MMRSLAIVLLFVPEAVSVLKDWSVKERPHLLSASLGHETVTAMNVHMYRQDCGFPVQKPKTSLLRGDAKLKNPGAGTDPAAIAPFEKILKDGFYEIDCVKDYMFEHGDKFGDNKHEYELGDISNVSIVHYTAHVAKEQQEPMTHAICFAFCRGIPEMMFFGIKNGRECYCTPYYQQMAGDSSMCDAPCDGNAGMMCGGKSKSAIFQMHQCADTAADLKVAAGKLGAEMKNLDEIREKVRREGIWMQLAGKWLQKMFGPVGDIHASDLQQRAKAWAGELEDAAKKGKALHGKMEELEKAAGGMNGADFSMYDKVTAAEDVIHEMETATAAAEQQIQTLDDLYNQAVPNRPEQAQKSESKDQFYPIMYFVDKNKTEVPVSCSGKQVLRPIHGNESQCSLACNAEVHNCVGFVQFTLQIGNNPAEGLCFLFSKFKSVMVYDSDPKCDTDVPRCQARFSNFDGINLNPQGSGKCDICLQKYVDSDRCYIPEWIKEHGGHGGGAADQPAERQPERQR